MPKWILDQDETHICATEFTCSECDFWYTTGELTDKQFLAIFKYCPNCGAKMEEEDAE